MFHIYFPLGSALRRIRNCQDQARNETDKPTPKKKALVKKPNPSRTILTMTMCLWSMGNGWICKYVLIEWIVRGLVLRFLS